MCVCVRTRHSTTYLFQRPNYTPSIFIVHEDGHRERAELADAGVVFVSAWMDVPCVCMGEWPMGGSSGGGTYNWRHMPHGDAVGMSSDL